MGENTKIEWTDFTFNPWRGCTKVSDGCKNCYAETLSKRNPATLGVWGDQGTRVPAAESYWRQPFKWNKDAARAGVRRRVFCASLADVFEDNPAVIPARRRLWDTIDQTRHLDWLLLTKRPENFAKMLPWGYHTQYHPPAWPNVWLGVTAENQEQADKRIPEMLKVSAAVRFISAEPLLGEIDLVRAIDVAIDINGQTECPAVDGLSQWIHWVIVGGESGPGARPMHPDWVRSLRDQCTQAGVPFFFKQWGEWAPHYPGDAWEPTDRTLFHYFSGGPKVWRIGKTKAGRQLNGRMWDEFPAAARGRESA